MVPRPLDRSGVEAQGEAGGEHNLTRTPGGVSGKQWGGVPLPSVCIPAGRLPGPHAGRTTSRDERPHA